MWYRSFDRSIYLFDLRFHTIGHSAIRPQLARFVGFHEIARTWPKRPKVWKLNNFMRYLVPSNEKRGKQCSTVCSTVCVWFSNPRDFATALLYSALSLCLPVVRRTVVELYYYWGRVSISTVYIEMVSFSLAYFLYFHSIPFLSYFYHHQHHHLSTSLCELSAAAVCNCASFSVPIVSHSSILDKGGTATSAMSLLLVLSHWFALACHFLPIVQGRVKLLL